MRAAFLLLPSLLAAACSTPPSAAPPPAAPAAAAVPLEAIDDGSYLDRIDPLGGQWDVVRIGGEDFRRYEATINFQGGASSTMAPAVAAVTRPSTGTKASG